tara:strand:+ start:1932 stop:2228 length:297 start_codon:yes stop_codon:yes gene_type:complete
MVSEKTEYGIIQKNLMGQMCHVSFSSEYGPVVEKEESIATYLIDEGYDILEKEVYYIGGGVQNGADTYWVDTYDYSVEPYEWIDYGKWKVKYKIKKRK